MENEKKSGKGSIVVVIVLLILVLALGAYVLYDKFYTPMTSCTCDKAPTEENVNKTEENVNKTEDKDKDNNKETNNTNSVTTRTCVGVYSGNAPISMNAQTKELNYGSYTIELSSDGRIEFISEGNVNYAGKSIIVENALLVKTSPDVCGPGQDCSERYTQLLNISEDCSTISGYNFGESYTLTKSN